MFSRLTNVSSFSQKTSILYRLVGTSTNASSAVATSPAAAVPADGHRRYPHDAPERDFVNYPAFRLAEHGGKARFGIVPVEWCDAMYAKTGVTGPFILFWGGLATLFSKEYLIASVDFPHQVTFFIAIVGIAKLAGPKISAYLNKEVDKDNANLMAERQETTKAVGDKIVSYEALSTLPQANAIIHEAKRENVLLQLEAAYRQRLQQAYQDVKKRLDYQVSIQNAFKRLEREQAINYINGEVSKSIGATQEKEAFASGLSQLKALSQKYAGKI